MWPWIEDQLLGMHWLDELIGRALSAIGIDITGRIGASIQFFLYDVIKISVLLCVFIGLISYAQSYMPPERSRRLLGKAHGIWANILGALLGTITPFCSCSSIPLFIGFTRAGLPLGVTFSFLISSPMVDLASVMLLMSVFGAHIAILYVVLGLMLAVIGGTLIERLHMDDQIASFALEPMSAEAQEQSLTQRQRWQYASAQVRETLRKVIVYVLVGVALGAIIHNWIPQQWVQSLLGSDNPWGVPLATLVGAPMYADIFGTIPIAESLLYKGAQLGTVIAFMMAVTTLSLPSVIMLRRIVRWRLLAVFLAICVVGIMVIGYACNWLQWLV